MTSQEGFQQQKTHRVVFRNISLKAEFTLLKLEKQQQNSAFKSEQPRNNEKVQLLCQLVAVFWKKYAQKHHVGKTIGYISGSHLLTTFLCHFELVEGPTECSMVQEGFSGGLQTQD